MIVNKCFCKFGRNTNKHKMKTENHSINDVLAKNATSFFIPPFQRSYAWGKPEIERYFSDVKRIINSELNPKEHDKLEHFFGTLVIKEERDGFANKSVVVDGQQRLTTTLIFLIALRDCENDLEKKEFIKQNYLYNNSSKFQDKIKLKQVTKDWDAFKAIVNEENAPNGIINSAYILFKKLILNYKITNPEVIFEHYITAIQRLNVAVIFLDERPFKGEDPQIIFETLNSLGKPLSLSDLIRNFVLLSLESDSQSKIYENIWYPKIELILGEYTSEFFRDYLQYKTCTSVKVVSDNNTKEVYQLFKEYVNNKFITHDDFICDIVPYVKWYNHIISKDSKIKLSQKEDKNNEINELLRNIFHDIKSEAFKPFVLGLLEFNQSDIIDNKISDDLLISILKTIRIYLIRRRVLGLTQGENKNIVLLCSKIEDLATNKTNILFLLTNLFYRLRLPNDIEMRNGLSKMNFYQGLKKYSKFILGKIEEHNTKVSVDFRNPKITIEHILPQKIDIIWQNELGSNYENIQKQYLHNIGNLILTEFNSEIGNRSFEFKKNKISTSSLSYRLDIINKEVWNENSIIEHQNVMINRFLETFNLPIEYKERENWNSNIKESTEFSPLEIEPSEIAGEKPSMFIIEGKAYKVKTWQDVFLKFIQYIYDNPNYDFGVLLDYQQELFKNENTIIKWQKLEKMVDENIDVTNRYKTFDGKIWSEIKEMSDDMYFAHINISALTCINRIANVMNKFNIQESSVKIQLK